MHLRLCAALLASAAFVLPHTAAFAIEPDAAAKALGEALVKGTGGKASFASATADGSDVVIKGFALTSHDASDTVTFDNTVIAAPTEGGDAVFSSPNVAMTAGTITGESTGSLESLTLSDVTVPKTAADTAKPGIVFGSAEALNLAAGKTGESFKVTVARVAFEMSKIVDNAPQASTGSVEKIVIPPEAFADADFKPEMLGYQNITLGLSWDGERDPATKRLDLRDATLLIEGGGTLTLTGVLGNLPEAPALGSDERAAAASEAEIHALKLRYEDDSLAGKVLDMQAQKQGVSREDYANQIAGALPFLLAALNNPGFQSQVTTALTAFLKDPQSLTVTVNPETPVTGAQLFETATTAPQTLPDRLTVGITANTAE